MRLILFEPVFQSPVFSWLYNFVVVFAAGYIYFQIFNVGETARRIRILQEISERGPMTGEELQEILKKEDGVGVRLERLCELGQLQKKDGAYFIRGRVLYRGSLGVDFWRRILGLKSFRDSGDHPSQAENEKKSDRQD